jgi:threonine aldolase
MFDTATMQAALREKRRNAPPQTLVAVEQTSNAGGGSVWPLALLTDVLSRAHDEGMKTHLDGARLMNAVVAASATASEMAQHCDSVWLDFTKGMGAPLGAVLCGSEAFIDQAWRWKQRLGGSLRQAGMCAAACLYALDRNVDRLAEDHANARDLARGLGQVPGLVVQEPETNLVFFDTSATGLTADTLAQRLRREGVLVSTVGAHRVRACTHLDVDAAGVTLAVNAIAEAVRSA